MLETRDLTFSYGKKTVLEKVSLSFSPGTLVGIIGPNGCGKTTLLRALVGEARPREGACLLDGRPLEEWGRRALARHLSFFPQTRPVPDMTVSELVSCGRYPYSAPLQPLSPADREVIAAALAETDLAPLAHRNLQTLSGGERQRARLAMTLAQSPELLLLDEPTTYLDVKCQFEILELIKRLNRERNISVLMVLHDLSLAAICSDRMVFLKDKKIHISGTPQEVMKPEIIRDVFGIETQIIQHNNHPLCLTTGKK